MEIKSIVIDANSYSAFKRGDFDAVEIIRHVPNTNDLWIAATAVQYGNAVFTYDDHFKHISTLKVISTFDDLML